MSQEKIPLSNLSIADLVGLKNYLDKEKNHAETTFRSAQRLQMKSDTEFWGVLLSKYKFLHSQTEKELTNRIKLIDFNSLTNVRTENSKRSEGSN